MCPVSPVLQRLQEYRIHYIPGCCNTKVSLADLNNYLVFLEGKKTAFLLSLIFFLFYAMLQHIKGFWLSVQIHSSSNSKQGVFTIFREDQSSPDLFLAVTILQKSHSQKIQLCRKILSTRFFLNVFSAFLS